MIVVEITTQIRGIAPEIALGRREGLPRRSVANFDQLRRVARSRLTERLGRLPAGRVIEAKRALGHTLGWPELAVLA